MEEEIKDFKTTMLEMISSADIENQVELSQAYKSLIQDFSHQQKIKYIENPIKLSKKKVEQTVERFVKEPIHKKFLQKKNIVLSPEMWRRLMLVKKKNVLHDYKVSVDKEEKTLQLSQLKHTTIQSKPVFILRLAEIKYNTNTLATTDNLLLKAMFNVDSIMVSFKQSSIDDLEDMINKCSQFAVHEYYLPEGLVDEEALTQAVLLYRYERVYAKEWDNLVQQAGHGNYGLPYYYSLIYPRRISHERLISESHLHFAEGVGAMYRLDDVSERKNKNNLNAGYALPISNLKRYLNKLINNKYINKEERQFYQQNDFGMHFLYLIKGMEDPEILLACLKGLDKGLTPTKDLKNAIKFMDVVDGAYQNSPEIDFDKEPIL